MFHTSNTRFNFALNYYEFHFIRTGTLFRAAAKKTTLMKILMDADTELVVRL